MSTRGVNQRRVIAAQRGDRQAQEEIARAYLPLVYNVTSRALGDQPDVEDVVQDTMLQVVRALPGLRQPESIRAWILAITMRQIGAHQQRVQTAPTTPLADLPDTGTEFEELSILRLRLSGQRRQVAEASHWLDPEERTVLALWWQEAAGQLDRSDVAAALNTTVAYAAVRIQRMRAQLDRSRSLVSALEARPGCTELAETAGDWDGRPGPLWRKRLDRHVRDCPVCLGQAEGQIAVERLLVGFALLPVPAALTVAVLGKISAAGGTGATIATATAGRHGLAAWLQANPLAATVTTAVVLAGGTAAYAALPDRPQPIDRVAAAPSEPSGVTPPTSAAPSPTPSRTTAARPAKTREAAAATPSPRCGTPLAAIWARWPMPNTAKYTNIGDGTVRDNVTCLIWQRSPAPDTYSFTEAKEYCTGLELDGGGWHLPTRIELTSIIDYTDDNPAIDTGAFPGTPPRYFWTSSPWAVTKQPPRAWIINFYEGLASNAGEQTGTYNVRCVRSTGGSGRPAYQITDGQVTDPATGLTWQRATTVAMPATDAARHCADLELGGDTWRLPTLKELATTVDETRVSPAIDVKAFPDTPKTGRYWSATMASPRPADRWMLSYNDGVTTYRPYDTGFVRCVR
jgi:RNA polymerase sigma factor (sigma-70 family)